MAAYDVVIVGGGVAGLSTAWHLARQGVRRLCVLEREPTCGAQASGTNAAIFRHFETHAVAVRLAVRSRALLAELQGAGALLKETGGIYLGTASRLAAARAALWAVGVPHELLTAEEVTRRWPLLRQPHPGLFVPVDGVVDVNGVIVGLQRALKELGAEVRTGAEVVALEREEPGAAVRAGNDWQVLGPARTPSGLHVLGGFRVSLAPASPGAAPEVLEAARLVLAGGAWSAGLGNLLELPVLLTPLRRHLALLEPRVAVPAEHPVAWRLEDEVYFRPESGGVLASPCDETKWPAGEVPTSTAEVAKLAEKLPPLAPELGDAALRRAWAGLRTFAPDRDFVVGPDPRQPGVTWVAGLGGRGITCGLALGEVAAAAVRGQPHPALADFDPGRLFSRLTPPPVP